MAKVRVGVKRIRHGIEIEEFAPAAEDDATMEVFIQWVEINGVRFDSTELGLESIDHHAGAKVHTIDLHLFSSGYATVDHRTNAPEILAPLSATGDVVGWVEDNDSR